VEQLIITPKTRIFDLLEAYPELENVLIEAAPQFRKLRNPVLRKTVTKVTNLGQAASIAGIGVEDLVNRLRREAGQDRLENLGDSGVRYQTERPEWFREGKVTRSIDIRTMLHEGEQPLHEVMPAINRLQEGEILEVIAPFLPAPLIDKSISLEHHHWVRQQEDLYHVYFTR
jgi:uncharacterized protein (DUF2249 family)